MSRQRELWYKYLHVCEREAEKNRRTNSSFIRLEHKKPMRNKLRPETGFHEL